MRLAVLFAAAASAAAAVLFVGASPARAFDDIQVGAPTATAHYNIGDLFTNPPVVTPGSVYSNVDNFTGFGVSNGGAVADAGNAGLTTTTLLGDDLNAGAGNFNVMGSAGWGMRFSVSNLNGAATTARFRIRFYLRDGAGGAPGTGLGGFSFTTTSIPSGVTVFTATGLSAIAGIPANTTQIWASMFFDNSGAASTTAAQLNNLGQGTFNPPVLGTSGDQDFLSGTPTDTFLVSNPTGSVRSSPFAGNPVANYGWEITAAPEPASIAVLGLSALGLCARRRRD